MCLTNPRVHGTRRWNWDGDRIEHDAIVPSSRPPIGRRTGAYDIDVREFLVTERNAVMRRTLERDVKSFVAKLPGASWDLFTSRTEGSFDHRADLIAAFVGERIRYRYSGRLDPWQFPDETLSLKEGDCEDRALLLASLLLASGISSFNVRVALGKFRHWNSAGRRRADDHCWVMYKSERGDWLLLEPAHAKRVDGHPAARRSELPVRAEYVPLYLFNDVHLWSVAGPNDASTTQPPKSRRGRAKATQVNLARDWSRVHPTFAGIVHKGILNDALPASVCPPWALARLNRHFTSYFWVNSLTVDAVDAGPYDPRDHFDNAYIEEGWERVAERLGEFSAAPATSLDAFFYAAHGIADFYAHTTYAHFAQSASSSLPIADPADLTPGDDPDYGAGSEIDLTSGKFTMNSTVYDGTPAEAAAHWEGRVLSGRYAQPHDSHGAFELVTSIPKELRDDPSFRWRGSMPHHNEIAVDDSTRADAHILYSDAEYAKQYRLRYDAAVRHIRKEFTDRWNP